MLQGQKMEVTIVVDEQGLLRVVPGPNINDIELKALLTSAFQLIEDNIQKRGKIVRPPFMVDGVGRG
jgi:hypothetical protein